MGKKSQKSTHKSQKIASSSWVDFVYSSSVFVFPSNGSLDRAFLEVFPSFDWGTLTPTKDERISSKYGDCGIPFYQWTF